MANLVMSKQYTQQHLDKHVRGMAFQFLTKLCEDDTAPGLHIEPINNSVDKRVRTGRVNQQYRAVLYKLAQEAGEPTYLLAGVWNHDDAIEYARKHSLRTNPVNGMLELIEAEAPEIPPAVGPESDGRPVSREAPILTELSYFPQDLVEGFGFSPAVADFVFGLSTADEVRKFAATLSTTWHAEVLDGMLAGMSVLEIQQALDFAPQVEEDAEAESVAEDAAVATEVPSDVRTDDEALLNALRHPAARAQCGWWRTTRSCGPSSSSGISPGGVSSCTPSSGAMSSATTAEHSASRVVRAPARRWCSCTAPAGSRRRTRTPGSS